MRCAAMLLPGRHLGLGRCISQSTGSSGSWTGLFAGADGRDGSDAIISSVARGPVLRHLEERVALPYEPQPLLAAENTKATGEIVIVYL